MSRQQIPDTAPRFPADRTGVAILGCGAIAHTAHLPAYQRYGVQVVGVWSRHRATVADVQDQFPFVQRVYGSAEDLLSDPDVRIVDLATGPHHRLAWLEAIIDAGKHALVQKPLTLDEADLNALPAMLERAVDRGLRIAVNHNARWAPPWRMATLLLRQGAIGEVVGITHLHDKPLPPLVGTPFDAIPHMLLTDYLLHWIDITRTWLAQSDRGGPIRYVQATDSRVPGQPHESKNPWSATMHLTTTTGATAALRIPGNAVTARPECPFWIHGTTGTLRGSVLMESDRLHLDDGLAVTELPIQGAWFVDGFAGAMAELMSAIEEQRDPEHSAIDAAESARLMLAARTSAERGGAPVDMTL